MAQFKIEKKLDLSYLGDAWKDCYLLFSAITYKEVAEYANIDKQDTQKATEIALDSIENHFIEGYGIDEKGARVPIKKEDIKDLPMEIVLKAINFLTADLGKNV